MMIWKNKLKTWRLTVHQRLSFIYKTMFWYCLKVREKTDDKNPRVPKANKGKLIILPKRAACNTKKLRFIKEQEASRLLSSLAKEQEASRLLSSLAIKASLSKIPLVDPLLF